MIGGTIIQISGNAVEVLDESNFDRGWRWLENVAEAKEGDLIWWQSYKGLLTRRPYFEDKNIGECIPCNPHGR